MIAWTTQRGADVLAQSVGPSSAARAALHGCENTRKMGPRSQHERSYHGGRGDDGSPFRIGF